MPQSFCYIKLYVEDHAAMVQFYTEVLGLKVSVHVVDGEGEDEHEESILGFDEGAGGELIIVQEFHRPAPPPGEVTMVFWVDDADAVAAAAVAKGGKIAIPFINDVRFDTRTGYIADPEGHRFQLMQKIGAAA